MSENRLSSKKKIIRFTNLLLLFITASLIVACAAGTSLTPEAAAKSATTQLRTKMTGTDTNVLDVTNYYMKPEIASPRPGGGMAVFETENFVGSSRCAVCHELLVDSKGNDMSISGHWRSTMMANAATDPLWQAKVSSEIKRNPALKKVLEAKCTTCHMPMAWTQAYKEGKEQLLLDEGFLSPKNDLHAAAMDGVSCSLCHQIQDENLGQKKSFSGKFVIDTSSEKPARKIFGPYENPLQEVMQKSVGYTPVYGAHTNDSALCATCHTLFTPYVDAQGNVAGEFPEQVVYLEWKHSEYGVNCGTTL